MEPLFEALYTYTYENRFDLYTIRHEAEWQENETMIRRALDELKSKGMGDTVQRISNGLMVLSALDLRSAFWAGLSMGLELNRL